MALNRTQVDTDRLLFTSDVPTPGFRTTVVVHWSAFDFVPSQSAVEAVSDYTGARPETSELWFVYPKDCSPTIQAFRKLGEYGWRASSLSGLVYRYFHVDLDGRWVEDTDSRSEGYTAPIEVTAEQMLHVKADGMRQIFRDTDSLVSASAGFHFERPGRGHSNHFIRTSQSVARAQHAYFIAACMLPHIKRRRGMKLFADTAGILPLLSATVDLWRRLGATLRNVSVDSFGGYDGAKENLRVVNGRDYTFISSSTSGTLAASLVESGLSDEKRIITVFYLSPELPTHGTVICDLTNRDETPRASVRDARFLPYPSYRVGRGTTCELCRSGSHPIQLVGDDFFPAAGVLQLRMPVFSDRPLDGKHARAGGELRKFDHSNYFDDFYGLAAVTGTYVSHDAAPASGEHARRFRVSTRIGHLLASADDSSKHIRSAVEAKLSRITKKHTVSTVFGLTDDDSRALAGFVASGLWKDRAVEVANGVWRKDGISHSLSIEQALKLAEPHTLVVGCAGVIASGRALINMSRSFRDLDAEVETAYLVGVAHPESANARDIFFKSLGVQSSEKSSGLEVVWELPREPGTPGRPGPWSLEVETLGSVEGWLSRYDYSEERRAIGARLQTLTYLRDEHLFGSPLITQRESPPMLPVNPKFALWPFEWSTHPRTLKLGVRPTQPEVYATVAHLLYSSRRSSGPAGSAPVVARHGFAINPAVFDRFNEPQIQSSILRAAEPGELHYHSAVDASRAAADFVKHALDNATSEALAGPRAQSGGAAYEILLSISAGLLDPRGTGLRLSNHSMKSVLASITRPGRKFERFPPIIRGLLYFIEGEGYTD